MVKLDSIVGSAQALLTRHADVLANGARTNDELLELATSVKALRDDVAMFDNVGATPEWPASNGIRLFTPNSAPLLSHRLSGHLDAMRGAFMKDRPYEDVASLRSTVEQVELGVRTLQHELDRGAIWAGAVG